MNYYVIRGQPIWTADAMLGILRRNGFQLEYLERSAERVTIRIRRDGQVEAEATAAIDDIREQRRLRGRELGEPWLTYPAQLLANSALRGCVDQLSLRQPDLFAIGEVQ
jgi:hypothetical protein